MFENLSTAGSRSNTIGSNRDSLQLRTTRSTLSTGQCLFCILMQYLSVCSLRKLLENLVTDVTDVVFVLCHVTYIVPNTIRVICHVSVLDVRHFPPAIPNSLGLILPRGFFPTMLRGLRGMTMHDRKKMHFI